MAELLQLPPQLPQPELPVNSSTIPQNPTPHNSYSKRQRRPSVRLGDIGVNSFRQNKLSWNNNSSYRYFDKSRTRNIQEEEEEEEENKKVKRGGAVTKKRVRHGGENNNWYRDGGQSESPSPMREQQESPNNNNYLEEDVREWEEMEERSGGSLEDSVRMWLIGLGLGRYEPVFEIHEVDEEVLPLLTLDDLKEMGINAVGSRRKLYSAIQKLAKGFS
ncbi:hypothetical protein IFM89_031232 [Coptis chinensis]|uniref:SAM domain-containing protein n=1 Tax=Coptis chinensis TaxID=261450 RepID=A0A835IRU8_9MAGN|nr:hypothetical protein IFM89_031232 [Coptis chinensis]